MYDLQQSQGQNPNNSSSTMGRGGCSALFVLLSLLCAVGNGLNDEGIALLSFKETSITEDPYASLANWNSSDQTPCAWNGITCKQGRVVSLTLPRSRLNGSLPTSLGPSLPFLRHLNLRNNMLVGPIPPSLFRANSLQSLSLYMNSLSGPLPPEIADLAATLQILDLSHNSLNGSVPVSLLKCTRLRSLVLGHNNFTGSLPFGMGRSFRSLERIDVSYNRLNGLIPDDIGNLSSLEGTADFSHNLFSGRVPAGLGNLPEKVYIDFSYNNLAGPVPRNGTLASRGPTAFAGNPGLCGPPLKNPCAVPPGIEGNYNATAVRISRRLSKSVVTAIVVTDAAVVGIAALIFYCLYRAAVSYRGGGKEGSLSRGMKGKECLCFRKNEEDDLSEKMEQSDLIPLDREVSFGLNELLQSTAFVLGKSEYGIIYKVVMNYGLVVAVRRLGEGGSQRFREFQREVEAIGRVRHSNIVALRAYYWSLEEKLLLYDYIPGGNLSTAIHGRDEDSTFSPLSWSNRLDIMKGIAKGLAFLHESSPKKYVHGDLKPNNVLLSLNMMPYISDFGLGRLAYIAEGSTPERPHNQFSDAAVSPVTSSRLCYQAPEALRSSKPSQKWDIYSFGVILLELVSGQSPAFLLDTQEMDLVQWFQLCIRERKPLIDVLDPYLVEEPDIEDEVIAVLKITLACVEFNPERRPSMKRVAEDLERLTSKF